MYRSKRFDGFRRELVDAAVERRSWRNRNSPLRVGGHDPDDDYLPWQLREGQHVRPGEFESRELPNGLRKSAHRGRILSVR